MALSSIRSAIASADSLRSPRTFGTYDRPIGLVQRSFLAFVAPLALIRTILILSYRFIAAFSMASFRHAFQKSE